MTTRDKELEKALCIQIAARSPFTFSQVYQAWKKCKSFDVVIQAVALCASVGLEQIIIPITRPTLREPDESHTAPGAGGSE